ncbi:MAG: hypothetical protein FWG75_09775 [Cystobacterineae bacterium]|nr:hypothetical protein [Cystobacterineae bacterium]
MSGILQSLCTLFLATPLPEEALHAGRIHGGWGYIIFSYALAWLGLLAYAAYLLLLRSQLSRLPPPSPLPGGGPADGHPTQEKALGPSPSGL